jgi:polyisoprenoid-binding protein YceI
MSQSREGSRARWGNLALTALVMLALPASAQTAKLRPAALGPESRLWVEGDSTLHKYRLDAKDLDIEFGATRESNEGFEALMATGHLKALVVRVPLTTLTSGEEGLDDNMKKAMRADLHPEVGFRMESYQPSPGSAGGSLSMQVKGRLEINGVEKLISFDAVVTHEGSALHIVGEKQLLMSDYDVKAPTFMLGAMKVSDPVTVHFDLFITPTP